MGRELIGELLEVEWVTIDSIISSNAIKLLSKGSRKINPLNAGTYDSKVEMHGQYVKRFCNVTISSLLLDKNRKSCNLYAMPHFYNALRMQLHP